MSLLQDFLDRCREYELARNTAGGLQVCDQLLAREVKGRIRAAGLRQKAMFLLMTGETGEKNVGEAVGNLVDALPLTVRYPADRAHVLHLLVTAFSHYGSWDIAQPRADEYFQLAAAEDDWEVRKWIPKVWFNLGYCYNVAKRYEDSAKAYTTAIETAGDNAAWFNPGVAEHNLVEVLLTLGQTHEALAMLSSAEKHLSPARWGARIREQEAECFLALGHPKEAFSAASDALTHLSCTNDVAADATFLLARAEYSLGRIEEADYLAKQAHDLAIQIPFTRVAWRISEFQKSLASRKEVL